MIVDVLVNQVHSAWNRHHLGIMQLYSEDPADFFERLAQHADLCRSIIDVLQTTEDIMQLWHSHRSLISIEYHDCP